MRYSPLRPDHKGKKPIVAEEEYLRDIHAIILPLNGVVCALLALYYFIATERGIVYLVPGGKSRFRYGSLLF